MATIKQRTPAQTAKRMRAMYGENWRIHASYNMMQYDRDTPGWAYWLAVINTELRGERK